MTPQERLRAQILATAQAKAAAEAEAAAKASTPVPTAGGNTFRALTEGSQAGLLGGYDDELAAGMLAPVDAAIDWAKGDGFDMGRAYTRKQQMLDAQKATRREEHPVASIAGEIAGGLALPGVVKGAPALAQPTSTVGKMLSGMGQGAAYGGVYGSGEAAPGERLEGAAKGAALGAAVGGAVSGAGAAMANKAAQRAQPLAPTIDDLHAQGTALYNTAKNAGVTVKPDAIENLSNRLGQEMKARAFNPRLQPKTAIVLEEIAAAKGQTLSLPELDNFRKMATTVAREATEASDKAAANRIVSQIDDLMGDTSSFSAGSHNGIKALQEARGVWKRKLKSEVLEDVFNRADLDTSKYTQSGLQQTIVNNLKTLAKNPKRFAMFDGEEKELIKQIIKGTPSEKAMRWIGKFSPRGVVSFGSGQLVGSAIPGGNILVPGAGFVAAKTADKMSEAAFNQLQQNVARGQALPLLVGPNKLKPLIPGAVGASTAMFHR